MGQRDTSRPVLSLDETAEYLDLPVDAVVALARARFLPISNGVGAAVDIEDKPGKSFFFRMVDLKAFLARNADFGSGNVLNFAEDDPDPQALVVDLDARSEDMARRAFDIFSAAVPEARSWSLTERARFISQAKSRFEAILAVTSHGAEVDEALIDDLQEVGAAAAWAQSPLPQLLMVLRISRDLVVQTAVELAEERGGRWGLALSLLLTRVLPAMDRLLDALATGYWSAVARRDEAANARYAHVVEHSSDGIWEIDVDGRITYVNAAFALMVGREPDELDGELLTDLLPDDSGLDLDALTPASGEATPFEVSFRRADGVRRVLAVRAQPRLEDDIVVGFQGVARDTTAVRELEAEKNEFLALVTHDLRNPLSTIVGMGATLETHGDEIAAARIQRMGSAIRRQAERISRLADDLYDVSRLEASSLLLSPRPVDLRQVVEAALDTVDPNQDITSMVAVKVRDGVSVMADPRRLEQVVANLVANALEHGAAPVVIELAAHNAPGEVGFTVWDNGPGVPDVLAPVLFSRVQTLTRQQQRSSRVGLGTGLGLFLVKGLVEAMGGRVGYAGSSSGARFEVVLHAPRRAADSLTL